MAVQGGRVLVGCFRSCLGFASVASSAAYDKVDGVVMLSSNSQVPAGMRGTFEATREQLAVAVDRKLAEARALLDSAEQEEQGATQHGWHG